MKLVATISALLVVYLVIIHSFLTCAEDGETAADFEPLDGYFYELKPYIYTDESGQLTGLFVEYFYQLKLRSCNRKEIARQKYTLIEYKHNLGKNRIDWETYVELLDSNVNACLFPITSDVDLKVTHNLTLSSTNVKDASNFSTNNIHTNFTSNPNETATDTASISNSTSTSTTPTTTGNSRPEPINNNNDTDTRFTDVFSSEGLAVLVQREYISFISKLMRAMAKMDSIVILLSAAVFVGLLFWIIERGENEHFQGSFVHGVWNGVWLAIVTMTTVGYGDLAPRRLLSRCLAVVWMMIGMITFSFMVAIVSDEFSGEFKVKPILQNQKVAVLDGIDSRMFKEKYDTHNIFVHRYRTYEEVLESVIKGETFAAVMNSDVAAYYQDLLPKEEKKQNLLAVTALIKIEIPIKIMVDNRKFQSVNCNSKIHNLALNEAVDKHRKRLNIEIIHYDSIINILTCSDNGFFVLMLVSVLLTLGLCFDITNQTKMVYEKMKIGKYTFSIKDSVLAHTKAIMDPDVSFDDDIAFARKEMDNIHQSLRSLHKVLDQNNNIDSSV